MKGYGPTRWTPQTIQLRPCLSLSLSFARSRSHSVSVSLPLSFALSLAHLGKPEELEEGGGFFLCFT